MGTQPISTKMLPGCYKATVNESETITEAQPMGRVPGIGEAGEQARLRIQVFRSAPIERS
jgi:hypothetical protein